MPRLPGSPVPPKINIIFPIYTLVNIYPIKYNIWPGEPKMASAVTSIQIDVMTREKLRQFTRNGDTYDEVIQRLVEIARKASSESKG